MIQESNCKGTTSTEKATQGCDTISQGCESETADTGGLHCFGWLVVVRPTELAGDSVM
jgi:hypothetical protein